MLIHLSNKHTLVGAQNLILFRIWSLVTTKASKVFKLQPKRLEVQPVTSRSKVFTELVERTTSRSRRTTSLFLRTSQETTLKIGRIPKLTSTKPIALGPDTEDRIRQTRFTRIFRMEKAWA